MNILLTGITGNIGYEVAHILLREGDTVIPIVRSSIADNSGDNVLERLQKLSPDFSGISQYVIADLEKEVPVHPLKNIDCIIHCAGVVHFRKAGNSNENMMKNILAFAKDIQIPIYYVSTAYLSKPNNEPLFNAYETDKYNSEKMLVSSAFPHAIVRPSVVTGNSQTGGILHFSGYYLIIPAFLDALRKSDKIRFPGIRNRVNIIPVDFVARGVIDVAKGNKRGTFYIVNPNPPVFNDLLKQTMAFFGLDHKLEIVDVSFEEYQKLDLSHAEESLFKACLPFMPYLTTAYDFPSSMCRQSPGEDYITKILHYFSSTQNERLEE